MSSSSKLTPFYPLDLILWTPPPRYTQPPHPLATSFPPPPNSQSPDAEKSSDFHGQASYKSRVSLRHISSGFVPGKRKQVLKLPLPASNLTRINHPAWTDHKQQPLNALFIVGQGRLTYLSRVPASSLVTKEEIVPIWSVKTTPRLMSISIVRRGPKIAVNHRGNVYPQDAVKFRS